MDPKINLILITLVWSLLNYNNGHGIIKLLKVGYLTFFFLL